MQEIEACDHKDINGFCMDLQDTTSFPNVTASVSLATYTLDSFNSSAQAGFGNKVLSHFNTSSADIIFNFTNIKAGSITFDFVAVFTDGKETEAEELGAILLVRPGFISQPDLLSQLHSCSLKYLHRTALLHAKDMPNGPGSICLLSHAGFVGPICKNMVHSTDQHSL